MKIIVQFDGNGIHDYANLSSEQIEERYFDVLIKIKDIVEKFNKDCIDNA